MMGNTFAERWPVNDWTIGSTVAPPAEERSPFEAAAARLAKPYRAAAIEREGTSNLGPLAEGLAPTEPWQWGLMAMTTGPSLIGRAVTALPTVARAGLGALGFTLGLPLVSDKAEGAPVSKIRSGTSVFEMGKPGNTPELWHRIASRKMDRPLESIPVESTGKMATTTTQVDPASLEGKFLLPLIGDPTTRGVTLKSIDDIPLSEPFTTTGGRGYADELGGWAYDQGRATAQAKRIAEAQKNYDDVVGAYVKMGPQSMNFSRQTWGLLSKMFPEAKLTRAATKDINEAIEKEIGNIAPTDAMKKKNIDYTWPDFPGVKSARLEQHLADQTAGYRAAVVNAVEKARGKIPGVPDVIAARYAVTDPSLLYAPTNSAGLTMTRLTGKTRPSTHPDYPVHLEGGSSFGLGQQLPREVIFSDLAKQYDKAQPDPAFWLRKMEMASGKPYGQPVTSRWVDDVSRYIENVQSMGEVAAFDKYLFDRFKWK